MRADNHGEGGILALTALIMPKGRSPTGCGRLVMLGVFGTACSTATVDHAGDLGAERGGGLRGRVLGVRTLRHPARLRDPARSVPRSAPRHRRHRTVFGPVMVVWFAVLGVLGLRRSSPDPAVLGPSTRCTSSSSSREPLKAFLALGSIFLVVTGGEALYADMGHFGRRPIAIAGMGSCSRAWCSTTSARPRCCSRPDAVESPFYRMAPEWASHRSPCWRRWRR